MSGLSLSFGPRPGLPSVLLVLLSVIALPPGLLGCGDDGGGQGGVQPLNLVTSPPPIDLEDVDAVFYEGLAYDEFPLTALDILVPADATAAPLVVYIHGGGFTAGSRKGIYDGRPEEIRGYLRAGVAFASISYRLLTTGDTEGVLKPLNDSRRALQFLRYHAAEIGLDPERVVLQGGSAGAGTGLWLAFRDEMADPSSRDPIDAESTRVLAAAVDETQATYDLEKWQTVVFAPYELPPLLPLAALFNAEGLLLAFYGIDDAALIDSPEIVQYRADVDLLDLYTADDPPVWIENAAFDVEYPTDFGVLYHHAFHATALEDVGLAIGASPQVYVPQLRDEDPADRESRQAFTLRQLGVSGAD
ncbi:MAG TPA: carboxylesterase family protein [Polyangiaceae bacterium LLY-WYZ-14_1]|nr:carboxylesterase family protein [Polyangiaceae bacterium LLY-WYZ-14_1]